MGRRKYQCFPLGLSLRKHSGPPLGLRPLSITPLRITGMDKLSRVRGSGVLPSCETTLSSGHSKGVSKGSRVAMALGRGGQCSPVDRSMAKRKSRDSEHLCTSNIMQPCFSASHSTWLTPSGEKELVSVYCGRETKNFQWWHHLGSGALEDLITLKKKKKGVTILIPFNEKCPDWEEILLSAMKFQSIYNEKKMCPLFLKKGLPLKGFLPQTSFCEAQKLSVHLQKRQELPLLAKGKVTLVLHLQNWKKATIYFMLGQNPGAFSSSCS